MKEEPSQEEALLTKEESLKIDKMTLDELAADEVLSKKLCYTARYYYENAMKQKSSTE